MATLELQDARDGLADLQFSAASAGGDQMASGSLAGGWQLPIVLVVRNGDTTTTDVTVSVPGLSIDTVVTVPASGAIAVVPVKQQKYEINTDLSYSKVTSLEVAAVRL